MRIVFIFPSPFRIRKQHSVVPGHPSHIQMASSSLASTPVVQMDIFVKQVGNEAVLVSVSGTDTADTIRMVLQLGNTKIRLKQRVLKKDGTLERCGIKTGDNLTVFANNQPPKSSGAESFAVY